jgi:hypothetical protein
MTRLFAIFAAVAALSLAPAVSAAPNCSANSKPCGNSCISKDQTCHKDTAAAPKCPNGKVCGNTCIAKDKTCKK